MRLSRALKGWDLWVAPGTCFMKDLLLSVEGHGEVAGVGDLDDVGSDVTKYNVAKVQDVLWQLDSETVRGNVLVTGHFQAQKAALHKGTECMLSPGCNFFFVVCVIENS